MTSGRQFNELLVRDAVCLKELPIGQELRHSSMKKIITNRENSLELKTIYTS